MMSGTVFYARKRILTHNRLMERILIILPGQIFMRTGCIKCKKAGEIRPFYPRVIAD